MTAPAPGSVLVVGDPSPPASSHKATAALLYGLIPVILGAVVEVLHEATTLFAGAPAWVFTGTALLLVLLTPVASYFGAYRTPNRLTVPVQVLDGSVTPPS